jgi:putative flippase GtrA
MVIGGFNTSFGLLMFFSVGLLFQTSAITNLLLAYIPSTLVGYLTQKHFVWQTTGAATEEFPKFLIMTAVQATVNAILLWVAVEMFSQDKFLSQTLITVLAVVLAYLLQRNWVFRISQR